MFHHILEFFRLGRQLRRGKRSPREAAGAKSPSRRDVQSPRERVRSTTAHITSVISMNRPSCCPFRRAQLNRRWNPSFTVMFVCGCPLPVARCEEGNASHFGDHCLGRSWGSVSFFLPEVSGSRFTSAAAFFKMPTAHGITPRHGVLARRKESAERAV